MFSDENAQNQEMAKVRHINCGLLLTLLMLILITFVNKKVLKVLPIVCIVCDENECF